MGGLRVGTRLVSFARIAILARILLPAQFGLFGIAVIILAFLEILTTTGINVFFIQGEGKIKDYLDTAWVISIVRGVLIAIILVIAAPLVARFFQSPAALRLILLISIIPLLRGFINPAIVTYRKNLQFDKEVKLRAVIYSIDAIVSISLALITKNAASLIWGMAFGVMAEIFLSFVLFKQKPKFAYEAEKARKILKRGKWVNLNAIFTYFFEQGDDIAIGRILNTRQLGLYQMAYKISTLPITEVANVFNLVTFPVYVKIAGDVNRLKKAFFKTTGTIFVVVLPIGIILFLFPVEIIQFILGPNWIAAAGVLKVLAIFGVIKAVTDSSQSMFLAVKKQEYITAISFISFLGLAITIIPLTNSYGIVGAAYSAIIGLLLAIPVVLFFTYKVFKNG